MPALVRSPSQTEASRNANINNDNIRRCWICQQDDIDDTPDNSTWKKPCPCSFTAHDSCLLEWISNEEAPKPGDIARDRCIRCPQCKVQINIQRPRDYLVNTVEIIQRFSRGLVYPAAAASVLTCTYAGFLVYGINVFRVIFGSKEAQRVLYTREHPMGLIWSLMRTLSSMTEPVDPHVPASQLTSMSKVFLGAPLIAPSLVLLRTKWADKAFSFMIPWYFMYPANQKISWPPSPGLVFLTIPYLRTAYNEIYRLIFSELETKWEMAVQRKPRVGETEEQVAQEAVREEDEDAFFEVRVALRGEENIDPQRPNEELLAIPPRSEQMQIRRFPDPSPTENNDTEDVDEIERILQPLVMMDDNDDDDDIDDDDDTDHDSSRSHGRGNAHDDDDYEEYGFDEDGINLHPLEFPTPRRNSIGETPRDRGPDPPNYFYNRPNFEGDELVYHDFGHSDHEMPRINAQNIHAPNHRHRPHHGPNLGHNQRPVVHHFSANSLASLVMGALAFPFISATVGDILKYTLPSSLVTSTVSYSWGNKFVKKGLLTEKWGRTVIGGCLFVFIKDAVTLYCKWKSAKIFGKRIVMDYAGDRKEN